MKLRTKIFIITSMGILIPLTIGLVMAYNYEYDLTLKDIKNQLVSEAFERGISLEQINELRIQQLKILGGTNEVQNMIHITNLIDSGNTVDKSTFKTYHDALDTEIIKFKGNSGGENGFDNVRIINKSGKIIFSTDKSLTGKDLSKDPLFLTGLKKDFRTLTLENGNRKVTVAVPIMNYFDNSADTVGVLMASTNPFFMDKILLNREGLGSSGEAYLVNSDKILITPSRFVEGTFKQKIDTIPVRECFENRHNSETIQYRSSTTGQKMIMGKGGFSYTDHRGTPVYGVSFCEQELGYVLLVEKDQQEVLEPLLLLQAYYVMTGTILYSIAIAFTLVSTKRFLSPINNIIKKLHKITLGDLETEIKITNNDELSELATHINNMKTRLKNIISDMDYIIETRTLELGEANKELGEANKELGEANKELGEANKELGEANKELGENQIQINKQLKEISRIQMALDENSLVATTDKYGNITYANKKFCDVSKYSYNELIGQNHRILKSGYHSPQFFEGMWKTISSGKVWHGEIKNMAKDGTYYWVKTAILPILGFDKKPIGYVSVRTDITEEKLISEKLQNALEELKEIDRRKDEFGSMVSHELRTPLIPILGYCEMYLDHNVSPILDDSQRQIIQNIYKNAKKMKKMIEDILLVQKLEMYQIKFQKEDIELVQFMKDIQKDYEITMKQKNIEFVNITSEKGTIISDRDRLSEVFSNLIQNAVDFVQQNGKIETGAKLENNAVIFHVKDNGVGIAKDKQKNLFKKFYQIDTSSKRHHGGTGLGLAICKEIVEGLGGRIWVESKEEKGSTFYFQIPKE